MEHHNFSSSPKIRLSCEQLEDRITPSSWLDDYAAWWDRNLGGQWYDNTIGAATDWVVHKVSFIDETLANASDWELLGGTALVAVPVGIGLFAGGEFFLGVGTFGAAADTGAAAMVIQFGANPNQVYHTFRHVVASGMNQGTVQTAIQADLTASAATINVGLNVRTIVVAGQQITYNAFKFPNGVVNVGRITIP